LKYSIIVRVEISSPFFKLGRINFFAKSGSLRLHWADQFVKKLSTREKERDGSRTICAVPGRGGVNCERIGTVGRVTLAGGVAIERLGASRRVKP
jgi:hypothetical protein